MNNKKQQQIGLTTYKNYFTHDKYKNIFISVIFVCERIWKSVYSVWASKVRTTEASASVGWAAGFRGWQWRMAACGHFRRRCCWCCLLANANEKIYEKRPALSVARTHPAVKQLLWSRRTSTVVHDIVVVGRRGEVRVVYVVWWGDDQCIRKFD